jgi:hypothetical protein
VAAICQTVGLNPLTKPLDFITLQGKLTLYANKGAAEQLRSLHGVSIKILSRQIESECYVVHAQATRKNGQTDESIAAVPMWDKMPPAERANALMKCETKAKRRVTLSICGLGILDESELDTVNGHRVGAIDAATSTLDTATTINAEIVTSPAPSAPPPAAEPDPAPQPPTPKADHQSEIPTPPAEQVNYAEAMTKAIGVQHLAAAVRWLINNKWITSEQAMDEDPFKHVAQPNAEKVLKRPQAFLRAIGVTTK